MEGTRACYSVDGSPASPEDVAAHVEKSLRGRFATDPLTLTMVAATAIAVVAACQAHVGQGAGGSPWWVWAALLAALAGRRLLRGPQVAIRIEGDRASVSELRRQFRAARRDLRFFGLSTVARHSGIDKKRNAGADRTVEETPVKDCSKRRVRSNARVPCFVQNGHGVILLPGFAVTFERGKPSSAVRYARAPGRTSSYSMRSSRVPRGAVVEGHTWAKVNADGKRDRRFKGNYEVAKVRCLRYRFGAGGPEYCSVNGKAPATMQALASYSPHAFRPPVSPDGAADRSRAGSSDNLEAA